MTIPALEPITCKRCGKDYPRFTFSKSRLASKECKKCALKRNKEGKVKREGHPNQFKWGIWKVSPSGKE